MEEFKEIRTLLTN